MLGAFEREIKVTRLLADERLTIELPHALAVHPDVAIVSLDTLIGGLDLVSTLRSFGFTGGIMALCSRYSLPTLEELTANDIQSIVSSLAGANDLEAALYAIVQPSFCKMVRVIL